MKQSLSTKKSALALTLLAGLATLSGAAHADKLDDIKQAGVVRIAVFDSNPHLAISIRRLKSWWGMTWTWRMLSRKISV